MTRVLLVGTGDLADEVAAALEDPVRVEKADGVPEALAAGGIEQVTVVTEDDATALRATLVLRSEDRELPLLVTLDGPVAAAQVAAADEHAEVTSMAQIVAPTLAGACFGVAALRAGEDGARAVELDGGRTREEPWTAPDQGNRTLGWLAALARPYDRSAALLVYGFLGLVAVLAAETGGAVVVLDQGPIDALYGATKTLVTVDPNDGVAKGPKGFKLFTTVAMLCALFFEALFTAGIVNRLIDRRLTGWVGKRSVPRRGHVVVVGLGSVGLELCEQLRAVGVRVVGVDAIEEGEAVGVARERRFPVVVGRGGDPSLLHRLALHEACALVAATDRDQENLAVAMAARAIAPDLRIVLRVDDERVLTEVRSLLGFEAAHDVHRLAAALLAARAGGSAAVAALVDGDEPVLVAEDGRVLAPA